MYLTDQIVAIKITINFISNSLGFTVGNSEVGIKLNLAQKTDVDRLDVAAKKAAVFKFGF